MQIDYSVAQALMQHSVGTIATAIEQHSCYHGRDRFGRLKLLQEEEKEKIFKLLEDYHIQEKIWYLQNESSIEEGESPSDIFDCNFELPHWHFGWPKDNIPELLIIKNEIQYEKKESSLETPLDSIDIDKKVAEFNDEISKKKAASAPFESREVIFNKGKNTYLAIIGALIKQCNFDINEKKIANKIAFIVTQKISWPINERTVKNILKEIPDAIERRAK
jgi:hypothetical protein